MKKVLITGAHGFLGRYTAKKLKDEGHYIIGMGHGKWDRDEYNLWGIDEWFETTITFEALLNINKQFDTIIHCGGSGSVGFSLANPYEDFQKSVQSTLSLLEFIRLQSPGSVFIYPSSPAIQGNLGDVKIKEDMQSTPVSPYGIHKKIAEDLCKSYHNNYGINIGIIRFFSVYGEGLQKQLLWDACKKIYANTEVTFFGTGYETRDWIHVDDAAALIETFSRELSGFKVINGGTGVRTEIKEVVTLLASHFNKKLDIKFNGETKEGDPVNFWADTSGAFALNWQPTVTYENGLKRYVDYFIKLKG